LRGVLSASWWPSTAGPRQWAQDYCQLIKRMLDRRSEPAMIRSFVYTCQKLFKSGIGPQAPPRPRPATGRSSLVERVYDVTYTPQTWTHRHATAE
jgi:hypothetical protein